jgi:putative transcriptional regulator
MVLPESKRSRAAAIAGICATVLLASAGAARARAQPTRPAAGVFLVAKAQIDGGPFRHSVVLILSHSDEGTLGLIINRATEIPLAKALPDLEAHDTDGFALQFGGPVGLDGLLYLFSAGEDPPKATRVMPNVFFAGDEALLEGLLKKKESKGHLKFYAGHAGWIEGQLEMEIARGDWSLVAADAFTLFQREPETIWPALSTSTTVVAESNSRDFAVRRGRERRRARAPRSEGTLFLPARSRGR